MKKVKLLSNTLWKQLNAISTLSFKTICNVEKGENIQDELERIKIRILSTDISTNLDLKCTSVEKQSSSSSSNSNQAAVVRDKIFDSVFGTSFLNKVESKSEEEEDDDEKENGDLVLNSRNLQSRNTMRIQHDIQNDWGMLETKMGLSESNEDDMNKLNKSSAYFKDVIPSGNRYNIAKTKEEIKKKIDENKQKNESSASLTSVKSEYLMERDDRISLHKSLLTPSFQHQIKRKLLTSSLSTVLTQRNKGDGISITDSKDDIDFTNTPSDSVSKEGDDKVGSSKNISFMLPMDQLPSITSPSYDALELNSLQSSSTSSSSQSILPVTVQRHQHQQQNATNLQPRLPRVAHLTSKNAHLLQLMLSDEMMEIQKKNMRSLSLRDQEVRDRRSLSNFQLSQTLKKNEQDPFYVDEEGFESLDLNTQFLNEKSYHESENISTNLSIERNPFLDSHFTHSKTSMDWSGNLTQFSNEVVELTANTSHPNLHTISYSTRFSIHLLYLFLICL